MSSNDSERRTPIEIIVADVPERGRAARHAWGGLVTACGLAAGLLTGWVALPAFLYGRQEQPLTFNHRIHADAASIDCEDCHGFAADGSFMGIPSITSCAECHAEAQGATDSERLLIDEYVSVGREIPWLVYARQPDNVYFSHAPHVLRAAIECRRCHGDHGGSESVPVYQYNRISTYSRNIWGHRIAGGGPQPWDSMKMSACVGCHAEHDVEDHCLMCHK